MSKHPLPKAAKAAAVPAPKRGMPTPNDITTARPSEPPLRLGDVHDVVREHPAFTETSTRSLIQRGDRNGLNAHIYRVGRRVLIDLNGFQTWVRSKQR